MLLRYRLDSFLTSPYPISSLDGCRIGGTGGFIGNCPGPCPNSNIAADADSTNPSATYMRGSFYRVVWARNNHEGGFVRWSLVPINKMNDKNWHEKMAFHYSCWNVGRFNCNEFDFHRDCNYDRENEAFSKMLYIPPIYPDGDYVLAFTWYGGGEKYGHFGDYYDCSYIRIQGGGPVQEAFTPEFAAGGGSMYEDGCDATVDRLGICWKEPCIPIRQTSKMVPAPFKDGSKPNPVLSAWYGQGSSSVEHGSVDISRLRLVDARKDNVLNEDLGQVIDLNRNDEITLLAETNGDINYVEWFTNGKQIGRDYASPYTIAGDYKGDFYPWMHPLFGRRIRVAVKAVGHDGSFSWENVELRFQEVKFGGVSAFSGQSWEEFVGTTSVSSSGSSSSGSGSSANLGGGPDPVGGTQTLSEAEDTEIANAGDAALTTDGEVPNLGQGFEAGSSSSISTSGGGASVSAGNRPSSVGTKRGSSIGFMESQRAWSRATVAEEILKDSTQAFA